MKDLLEVCCGLDVHKEMIAACLLSGSLGTEPKEEVREFSTLLSGLEEMREWLKENNCRNVAMESTGVYWFPIYNVLEAGADEDFKFNITVANPLPYEKCAWKKDGHQGFQMDRGAAAGKPPRAELYPSKGDP